MMQEAPVIVYDADLGTVTRGPGFSEIASLPDVIDDHPGQ